MQLKQNLRVSKGFSKCHRGDGGLPFALCTRLHPQALSLGLPLPHHPGTSQEPGNIFPLPSSQELCQAGVKALSYWQCSLCSFQLPSRPIPGCLRGARPWASSSASYSQITQPALEFLNSFLCLGGFPSCSRRPLRPHSVAGQRCQG